MSPIRMPDERTRYIEEKITHTHRTGSILGIAIGGLICLFGIFLLVFGLTGSVEWLVNAGGFSSKLINASPGLVIVLVGMVPDLF